MRGSDGDSGRYGSSGRVITGDRGSYEIVGGKLFKYVRVIRCAVSVLQGVFIRFRCGGLRGVLRGVCAVWTDFRVFGKSRRSRRKSAEGMWVRGGRIFTVSGRMFLSSF